MRSEVSAPLWSDACKSGEREGEVENTKITEFIKVFLKKYLLSRQ